MTTPSDASQTVAELQAQIERLKASLAERQSEIDALRESQETYRTLLDESSDPIFSFYPDGTYRYVNMAFANGVGRRRDEIVGRRIWDVFSQEEADRRYAVVKWVYAHGQMREIEVRVPRPDGDRFYLTTAKPIINEAGETISVICISKEITERKHMEEQLRHLSTYDLLSGLYNRNFVETEVARLKGSRLFPISIIMVDLNHLKQVNDQFGHAAGDELIRTAATALRAAFRNEEIIARYGGDEFVVLLPKTDERALANAVERLRACVAERDNPLLSLAIGAATAVRSGDESLEEALRQADDRMYQEKKGRKW